MQLKRSLKELKAACSRVNHVLVKDGDEYEVYPRGKRGAASYFTTDASDAVTTAQAEFIRDYRAKVAASAVHALLQPALCEWINAYGNEWKELLYQAWINGNYRSFRNTNTESSLQKLRNTNGHEAIANL